MKKILGIVVLGLMLTGCATTESLISSGKFKKDMSKSEFNDAFMTSYPSDMPLYPDGGSEFFANSSNEIVWAPNKSQFFVFKNVSQPVTCGIFLCKIGNGTLESWHNSLSDARDSIKLKTETKAETLKTETKAETLKIDCQLSEAPGSGLPSEDLILLKQRTKPTFKINLDSKEVIAFNYGHSNENNVKIGLVKISDSEKIVWDREPYKGGYKKRMVYYTSWTYYKNEKKIKEDSITTKDLNTMKELIEKGKTNEFFKKNEYIYQCKLVEAESLSSSSESTTKTTSTSSSNTKKNTAGGKQKMVNEIKKIPGVADAGWPQKESLWIFMSNPNAGHDFNRLGYTVCNGAVTNFGVQKGYSITFWNPYANPSKEIGKYRCF